MRPLEALQETLAAEHAAVFVYAVLGGRLSASASPYSSEEAPGADLLRAAYEQHRARRDHVRSLVADLGAVPVPAAPAYEVDVRQSRPEQLLRVALETEQRCATVYAQLVAGSTGERRRWAVAALVDASVRALSFGAEPEAYPGLPEL